MDEKVLEEIEFHQETVSTDENSPLHLIREKEMEISGRVLSAKKEAEDIVSEARRKAATIVSKAEQEGSDLAAKQEETVEADVEREIGEIKSAAERDAETLTETIAARESKAVEFVMGSITDM